MTPELLSRDDSLLVVVDVQERLVPAVPAAARVIERVRLLLEAARLLQVPVIATEQYPKGLGPTVETVRAALPPGTAPVEKADFSCMPVPEFASRIMTLGREQIVVTGLEAHVCVGQTALDLVGAGKRVFVPADAVASRRDEDAAVALRRLERAGVTVTTAEAVVFEWLRRAGTPEFKALSPRIRSIR